ncbi:MAG: MarR family transcriptional regulator [Thaumarchaeota archaeon]|nr:MarR family transcriptional regulator [Nitrososphaerota archaeon]
MLKTSAKTWEIAADIELRERFGLGGSKWKIVVVLSIEEGITQKQLADMIFVEAPTLVPIIDKMEREGYLTRHPDPDDRRNNLIFMTKKSKEIVEPIIECILEIRSMALNKISKKDSDIVKKVLRQIMSNTEEFIKQKGEKIEVGLLINSKTNRKKILKV